MNTAQEEQQGIRSIEVGIDGGQVMQLIFCDNCELWCGQQIQIPNKKTGVADVYCEDCLPEEYRESWEKYKKENPKDDDADE